MEQGNKGTYIMVVKLVKGKVSGMQKFVLKEGNTLQMPEDNSSTNLKITSVYSCAPQDTDEKEGTKNMQKRCRCGVTFRYEDGQCEFLPSQKCRYCAKPFHDTKCLEMHIASDHNTIKNKDLCIDSATKCENQNEKSEDEHTLGQYHQCHYCKQCFHSADSLNSHLANVHKKNIKKCPCNNCNKSVQESDSEIMKKSTIQQPYKKYSCKPKKFFTCSICSRKFSSKSYMLDHEAGHSGVNAALCEVCGKMFPTLKMLRVHFSNNHNGRNVPCDFCGKLFANAKDMRLHLLVHTEEKPHRCDQCGRHFARRNTLMMHLRVHNNIKPHVCNICNKAFCQLTNLKTHMRNHGIFFRKRLENEKKIELPKY